MLSMFLTQIATVVVVAGSSPTEAARPAVSPTVNPFQVAQGKKAQPKNAAAKRKRILRRIRTIRAWRLTEALDLDTQTAARLFPILNRFDVQFAKISKQAGQVRRQMRRSMRGGNPNAAQLNALINQMVKIQRASWSLREARFRAVRKVLTPAQAAKILIILPEIDRRIRRQIRQAMRGQRGRRGGVKNPFGGGKGPRQRGPRGGGGRFKDPF